MPRRTLLVPCLLTAFVSCGVLRAEGPPADDGPESVDFLERDLRAFGIEPSRAAIVAYLESVRPSGDRRQRIRAHLENLGHADFRTRDRATRELVRMPRLPRELLEALAESDDPEVRMRARFVLREADTTSHRSRIVAVLEFVSRERLQGLAPLLMDLIGDRDDDRHVNRLFAEAIARSAVADDEEVLRKALEEGVLAQRLAAVSGLAALLGDRFDEELETLLEDDDEWVRFRASVSLLDRGRRDAMRPLLESMSSNVLQLRIEASRTLRSVTNHRLGFVAYEEERARSAAIERWRLWIDEHGANLKLRIPVGPRGHVELGRVLIGQYAEKMLREIDLDSGKTLWRTRGFTYLWGCHALPNGHRLAVDYNHKYVVEFDALGKKSWIVTDLPGSPTDVQRLENGNTLVTLAEPGIVVELSPEKQTVWKQVFKGRPTTAHRLASGRTLVCLQYGRRVVEIDQQGNVVWEIPNLNRPHTAQRLENGNTLVCEMDPSGRVVEFDPDGRLVWQKSEVANPAQAQRLANGNTLVSCEDGLHVFDPSGKLLQTIEVSRSRFFAF